jgi:hypothetical protein
MIKSPYAPSFYKTYKVKYRNLNVESHIKEQGDYSVLTIFPCLNHSSDRLGPSEYFPGKSKYYIFQLKHTHTQTNIHIKTIITNEHLH